MSPPGTVLTFYSYKGGTGRTMALANTAVLLARRNRGRVLMIDWDLEAPGLHDFFPDPSGPTDSTAPFGHAGVLELFEQAALLARMGKPTVAPEEVWSKIDFSSHVVTTEVQSLDLMPAGTFDSEYGGRVASLPWRELFESSPALFRSFADELAGRYSYVLIDSRTGVTDSSGICTTLLPDQLVLVFTPNHQSMTGALEMTRQATLYRSQSPDLRPLLVYPIVSRVEMSEDALRNEWRHGSGRIDGYQPQFEAALKEAYELPDCDLTEYFDEIQIQHVPRYAYGEQIAVLDRQPDRLSVARSYEQFAEVLVDGGGPWTFRRDVPIRAEDRDREEHLLMRAERDVKRHRYLANVAARRNFIFGAAEFAVVVVAALTVLAIWINGQATSESYVSFTNDLLPVLLVGVIVAGGIEFAKRLLGADIQRVVHSRAANNIEREGTLFEAGAGPYAGAGDPVVLFTERYAEIEADAEDALLERSPLASSGDRQSIDD